MELSRSIAPPRSPSRPLACSVAALGWSGLLNHVLRTSSSVTFGVDTLDRFFGSQPVPTKMTVSVVRL